jgi:hypothetical protein
MSDCLPFVQLSSATARPPACCCLELAGTVGSNPAASASYSPAPRRHTTARQYMRSTRVQCARHGPVCGAHVTYYLVGGTARAR